MFPDYLSVYFDNDLMVKFLSNNVEYVSGNCPVFRRKARHLKVVFSHLLSRNIFVSPAPRGSFIVKKIYFFSNF